MSAKPQIRIATNNDYEGCHAVDLSYETREVWQMDYNKGKEEHQVRFQPVHLPRVVRVKHPYNPEQLDHHRKKADCLLVAEINEIIVGYSCINLNELEKIAWIDIAVTPAIRRRKCGSALLEASRKWARHNRAQRLMVHLQTKNHPAISFYQKRGFYYCGYNEEYYQTKDLSLYFCTRL